MMSGQIIAANVMEALVQQKDRQLQMLDWYQGQAQAFAGTHGSCRGVSYES